MTTARLDSRVVVLGLLAAVTLAVYAQVVRFGFVFDDREVVLAVARTHHGLSPGSILWALGSFHAGNWFPVSLVSHLADIGLFGLDAGAHHAMNLAWHVVTAGAAFLVLRGATGATWRSAFAAAVFAVHPLNVESVAWVAERKNLLSTFLFWLTLAAYLRYVKRPGPARHAAVSGCCLLGLAAKPMLVTLPFVLLLVDFWPLGRLRLTGPPGQHAAGAWRHGLGRLLLEKVPWFLMAAAVSIVTLRAQASSRTVVALEAVPLGVRAANAMLSWFGYLAKAVWPSGLGAYYPLPQSAPPAAETLAAVLALAAATLVALGLARTRPYLTAGWLWYLGTLVPVIGLVQVGNQAMADRYVYLPLTGVLIAVAWWCGAVVGDDRRRAIAAGAAAVAIVAGLAIAARAQTAFWRDDRSLFERALVVTDGRNPLAHLWLGHALAAAGDLSGAEEHYRDAITQQPSLAPARNSLGVLLARRGRVAEAERELREAMRADTGHAGARYNLGRVLEGQGRHAEALIEYRAALALDADLAEAHNHIGIALAVRGDLRAAAAAFREALRADPGLESARSNLERALAELGSVQPPRQGL